MWILSVTNMRLIKYMNYIAQSTYAIMKITLVIFCWRNGSFFFNLYEFQYELLAHVPSISLTLCLCTNNITLWHHDCLCTCVCVSCCCRYFPPTSHSVVLAFATHSFTSGLCLKTDATRYCPTSWRHLTETLSAPSERVICFINHRRANECCLMWWRCDRIFHAFDSQRTMKYTCRPAYCLFVIHVMTEFN